MSAEILSQCLSCGETKDESEFESPSSSICLDCESDGEYLASGEFFEDAGGHVIRV